MAEEFPFDASRLARSSDVDTSHAAAENSEDLRRNHFRAICNALQQGPGTAEEVSDRIGGALDRVQVAKRWKEMVAAGLVVRTEDKGRNSTGRQAYRYELTS